MELRVLTIGGIDPSGGAGLSTDARTLHAHGVLALPIATALTFQNRFGFVGLEPVAMRHVLEALRLALADGPVHAIKVGLLADATQVRALAGWLRSLPARPPVVVDPVLSATAGGLQRHGDVATAYRTLLAPLATVFTPNLPECAAVLGDEPAAVLVAAGCTAVLVKGGHGDGAELVDRLVQAGGELRFSHRRRNVGAVRGTGCALGAALAAGLARGRSIAVACGDAIEWLQRCLAALPAPEREDAPARPLPLLPAR